MRTLIFLMSFLLSEVAMAGGWWCYAKAPTSEQILKWGPTLEGAKNNARTECNIRYGDCQITQCYEDNPYKYTCAATRCEHETTIGGFRRFSNSEAAARQSAMAGCSMKWGTGNCVSVCYPNFVPPLEEATPEDLQDAAAFSEE